MSLEFITIKKKAAVAADAYYAALSRHSASANLVHSGKLCSVLSKTYDERLDDLLRCLKKKTSSIEVGLEIDRTLETKRALRNDRINLQLSALVQ